MERRAQVEQHNFNEQLRAVLANVQEAVEGIVDVFAHMGLVLRRDERLDAREERLALVGARELIVREGDHVLDEAAIDLLGALRCGLLLELLLHDLEPRGLAVAHHRACMVNHAHK